MSTKNHEQLVCGKKLNGKVKNMFEFMEKGPGQKLILESMYNSTSDDHDDNYDGNVLMHITRRRKKAMKDLPEDTVVFDQYKADFKNHKLMWKGYSLDSDKFIEDANYMIRGKSNILPPSGDMSLYDFSMYTVDVFDED